MIDCNGHKETSGDTGNVLELDYGGGFMSIYICQNSNCALLLSSVLSECSLCTGLAKKFIRDCLYSKIRMNFLAN